MTKFTTKKDGGDFLSQDTTAASAGNESATKRHLLLKVPDYEHTGTPSARTTEPAEWHAGASKKNTILALGDADAFMVGFDAKDGNDLLTDQYSWLDDDRYRGLVENNGNGFDPAAIGTPPNEGTARESGKLHNNAAASLAIKSYVGWRDHTDGHRITTTRGDKIEVVGGNYKVISYGRGQGDAVFEMSGGLIVDGDVAPGDVSSVTWRPCPTDGTNYGWKVVEQTQKANTVERFHGTVREEHYGDTLISVTGAPAATTAAVAATTNNGEAETFVGEGSAATAKQVHNNTDVAPNRTMTTLAYPTKWDKQDDPPPALTQPAIYESTWAASVTSYTEVAGEANTHEVYKSGVFSLTELKTSEKAFVEEWRLGGSLGFQENFYGLCVSNFFGDRVETFNGAAQETFVGSSTTVGLANRFELFAGAEEQINIGILIDMALSLKAELQVGASVECRIGPHAELATSEATAKVGTVKAGVGVAASFVGRQCAAVGAQAMRLAHAVRALTIQQG